MLIFIHGHVTSKVSTAESEREEGKRMKAVNNLFGCFNKFSFAPALCILHQRLLVYPVNVVTYLLQVASLSEFAMPKCTLVHF